MADRNIAIAGSCLAQDGRCGGDVDGVAMAAASSILGNKWDVCSGSHRTPALQSAWLWNAWVSNLWARFVRGKRESPSRVGGIRFPRSISVAPP
jgi:hypothetical protein